MRLWRTFRITGSQNTVYMTRRSIGRLRLHVFERGDEDPAPHTHPWSFWTFPLTGYVEEVFYPLTGITKRQAVKPFRLHRRPFQYAHRVIARWAGKGTETRPGRIVTIVWTGGKEQPWGFWHQPYGDPNRWVP